MLTGRKLLLGSALFCACLALGGGYAMAEHGGGSEPGDHGGDGGDKGSDHGGGSDHSGDTGGGSDIGAGDHGGGDTGGSDAGGDHGGGDTGGSEAGGVDHGDRDTGGSEAGGDDRGGGDDKGGARDDTGSGTSQSGGSDTDANGSGKSGSSDSTAVAVEETTAHAAGATTLDLARDRDGREYSAHELVVVGDAQDIAALRGSGLQVQGEYALATDSGSVARIVLPPSMTPENVIAKIRQATPNATIDLNGVYRVAGKAPRTFAAPHATKRVTPSGTVGVIDTAVDPSFAPLVAEKSFNAARPFADPHGTIVAAIAAEDGARVYAANVFAADAQGRPAASADGIAAAIDWLVSLHVPVINLSISGPPNAVIARQLASAQSKGVIVVAAAGNDGPAAPPVYPAAYGNVVAVTATDSAGNVYRYANRGSYIMFAADGVDVETHRPPPASARISGTSFAAPVIAGRLAAQLTSPDPTAAKAAIDALRLRAKDLGPPGRDPIYGYGYLAQH